MTTGTPTPMATATATPTAPVDACEAPDGHVENADDCDDSSDAAPRAGGLRRPRQRLRRLTDEDDAVTITVYVDGDGDGDGEDDNCAPRPARRRSARRARTTTRPDDGLDGRPGRIGDPRAGGLRRHSTTTAMAATEVCDGIDNDCDGDTDDDDASLDATTATTGTRMPTPTPMATPRPRRCPATRRRAPWPTVSTATTAPLR